jgi:8-oxo-dGTP diphosphatase
VAKVVEVAAAVIERPDGSFLLARRPAGKVYAGWWEFPGGKIEAGEPAEAALARELHEELGIDVRKAYPWITRKHVYEHATVLLKFFRVVEWRGEPQPREKQTFTWQRIDEPIAEPMLPANAPVLASLTLPREYAVTDAGKLGVDFSLSRLKERLEQGLRMVQVRDKDLPDRAGFANKVIDLAHRYGAKVLVNGGAIAGGDGIHFTAQQLLALKERPEGGLAAASVHTRAELDHAMGLQLDFAVLGPVLPTASHPGAATLSWNGFAAIARGASIPVYGIGGLRRKDSEAAWSAGAHGLAMISGAWA